MGHYDAQREAHFDEERKANMAARKPYLVRDLTKLATALRTLGLTGAGVIEDAIEHIKD